MRLIGEAGAGKSRLLTEFLARLEAEGRLEGVAVRRVQCSSLGEQPYGVLASAVRDAYGVAPDDPLVVAQHKLISGLKGIGADEDDIARIAPSLGYLLGIDSGDLGLEHLDPEQLKRQIALALRTMVERRLQVGPLVWAVEDLHWADAASIEAMRFLVERVPDRAFMLIVVQRPDFDAGALATQRATQTAMRLARLTEDESEALLSALLGVPAARLPPHLRELIVARAGGNPFYIEEIVRGLIETGALVRDGAGWTCPPDTQAADIPLNIQGLLLARLDRMPRAARQLAQNAAILGSTFDAAMLRRIAGGGAAGAAVDDGLDLLCDAEMLEEVPRAAGGDEQLFRFTQTLVQEVVYQYLLLKRRNELHGEVGRVLEELYGGKPERLEEVEALGHHFSLSEDRPKGARYMVAAGDWARRIYANDDAMRHYERALATLEDCGTGGEERAQRVRAARRPARAERAPRPGLGALSGDPERVRGGGGPAGPGASGCARWGRCSGPQASVSRLRPGIAPPSPCSTVRWSTSSSPTCTKRWGVSPFAAAMRRGAVEWARRALEQAEKLIAAAGPTTKDEAWRKETATVISYAYNTMGVALARMGKLKPAVGHVERSVAVAEAETLWHAACRGYTNLGVLYSTLDPGRAIETCVNGLDVAKRIGDFGFQSRLYANLAVAYCTYTDRCESEGIAAALAAIDLDRQLDQRDHIAVPLTVLGQIYQCHGQPERALEYYTEAQGIAEDIAEAQLLFPCYDGLATLYLDMDDEARAEEYMLKAQAICEQAAIDPDSFIMLPFLD